MAGSGRHVFFSTAANNLVAGDTNGLFDVFRHDRISQSTQRLSVASDGTPANAGALLNDASSDGSQVVFTSSATNLAAGASTLHNRVYLRDLDTLTTSLIAVPGDTEKSGSSPSLSADGSQIVFINASASSGITSFNDAGRQKLYLFDRAANSYRALTWFDRVGAVGVTQSPRLTADGSGVVFDSTRSDLVADDGNGAFTDVFLLTLRDGIFADTFETP